MNIYVGNLSYEVTEEELQDIFKAFGEVTSVKIIKDKYSGQSKGFGFVEMPNKEDGESAINSLKNEDLKGRKLNVNEARPRTNGGGRGGRQSSRGRDGGRWDGRKRSW